MRRRFLYVINPVSGVRDKSSLQNIIEKKTTARLLPFEVLYTNAEKNYDFLPNKIKTDRITDVVICGGDGTVNQLAEALLGVNVKIGIVPLGSGNGLAFSAKIPVDINAALDVIFNGKWKMIDAFHINDKFSCMLCGVGFDAQVAHDFAKEKKRGLATYVKQSLKNFVSALPYTFSITANGKSFTTDAFFISIANSNQFGNNFTIAPKARLDDGLLDIVICKKMNKVKLVWAVLQQVSYGRVSSEQVDPFLENEVVYFQTDHLVLHNPGLAPLHIDGEPVSTAEKFKIRIFPKAIKLLQPSGSF
jgi:YegS/Rv2252/BmrU family lipid kinase